MEKLEKDPTELVWCAWKEGGSRNLETRWSLRGNAGGENDLKRDTPVRWGQRGGRGARKWESTSSTESQRTGERTVQEGGVIFDSRHF